MVTPTARDAHVTARVLASCGVGHVVCRDLQHLTEELRKGAGAILLTEDSLARPHLEDLLATLEHQPAWSEMPVILLMRGGYQSAAAMPILQRLGNVMILDRPASTRSVASAVQSAARSRQRQYQTRDQIQQIREAQEQRARLLESERLARQHAERASRMKDEFLATLSHELRTPMTAILGWAQMLRQRTDSAENPADAAQHFDQGLEVIERNARLQADIIEDLLDMSRIISGKVRLEIQTFYPGAVVQAAVDSIRPAAQAKRLHVEVRCDPDSGQIRGDPSRLQQVFFNLLTNAVKFTPQSGRIQVVCRRIGSKMAISVSDSGMGIKPDFLPYVFDRFRQQDASTTRAFGGLGLGLAIVKQLVELHGGTVRVESAGEGKGATFCVTLPISPVISSVSAREQGADTIAGGRNGHGAQNQPLGGRSLREKQLTGITVLVVDDEPDARELLRRLLESSGAVTLVAGSAHEALELLAQHQPQVLLSDIGMPTMDGYALIGQVRKLPKDRGGAIPAIALTAFARSEDRTKSILAGFQMHLSKPIETAELLASIKGVADGSGVPESA